MSRNKLWFILVGGINGAGKSTFTQSKPSIQALSLDLGGELEIINPDLVTRRIREENADINLTDANLQAAEECEKRVCALIKEGERSFAIETVLSTDKYKKIVLEALKNGYRVQFVYVLLGSVTEAIRRVKHRVARGGHNVPRNKIRSRWGRSLNNVRWFWENSTQAWIFFNGERVNGPFLVASRSLQTEFNPDALPLLLPE